MTTVRRNPWQTRNAENHRLGRGQCRTDVVRAEARRRSANHWLRNREKRETFHSMGRNFDDKSAYRNRVGRNDPRMFNQ